MSETTDRIEAVQPHPSVASHKPSTARKGLAPRIRKLKERFPEMSEVAIAKRVGCAKSNVHQVLTAYMGSTTADDLRGYQDNQADIFDAIANRLLSSLTQEKIDKTKPMEAITGAAILIDKARLVRGQATGINVSVLLDVVEAIRAKPHPQAIREASAPVIEG